MELINAAKLLKYIESGYELKESIMLASVDVVWEIKKIAGETFYVPCIPEREVRRGADD